MLAGACGAIVSNPFEVTMVRQISDLGKPAEIAHGYGNFMQALGKLGGERRGYFRGVGPSILKAMVLNGFLTGPYDYIKERMWITFGDVWPNTAIAILVAGVLGAVYTCPIDNIKTRMQNQSVNPNINRMVYKSSLDCANKTLMNEGIWSFYAGMYPYALKVLIYSATVSPICNNKDDLLHRSCAIALQEGRRPSGVADLTTLASSSYRKHRLKTIQDPCF